jgi:hypothetical protein
MDLSTGTNGAFSADPVGTLENPNRWKIVSGWGAIPRIPATYLTPISVDPAYIYYKSPFNFEPLPWATTPYVNPQTPGPTADGGGPLGRINFITYQDVNGLTYPLNTPSNAVSYGPNTLPYDNLNNNNQYVYEISFNAPNGGTLYTVGNADNQLELSLVNNGVSTPLIPFSPGSSTMTSSKWYTVDPANVGNYALYAPPLQPLTVPSATNPYYLQAVVQNGVQSDNNDWTALAVGAVFCPNSNPNGGSQGNETLVTQLNGTTIHEASFGTDDTVVDSAILSGVTSTATGTVMFYYFSGGSCTGPSTVEGSLKVNGPGRVGGKGAWSKPVQFSTPGTYSFDAVYSGDSNNPSVTSACELLTVTP